ncbi:Os08g0197200, partial [Oryza sativa Japonica Group]
LEAVLPPAGAPKLKVESSESSWRPSIRQEIPNLSATRSTECSREPRGRRRGATTGRRRGLPVVAGAVVRTASARSRTRCSAGSCRT